MYESVQLGFYCFKKIIEYNFDLQYGTWDDWHHVQPNPPHVIVYIFLGPEEEEEEEEEDGDKGKDKDKE